MAGASRQKPSESRVLESLKQGHNVTEIRRKESYSWFHFSRESKLESRQVSQLGSKQLFQGREGGADGFGRHRENTGLWGGSRNKSF